MHHWHIAAGHRVHHHLANTRINIDHFDHHNTHHKIGKVEGNPDSSDNLWTTKSLQTGGRNYLSYSNPVVDQLYEDGKREFDPVKRAAIYGKIHRTLWDDQPYTWLFFNSSMYAFNKNLRGYKFSPRGPFHYSPGSSSLWKPKTK